MTDPQYTDDDVALAIDTLSDYVLPRDHFAVAQLLANQRERYARLAEHNGAKHIAEQIRSGAW